MTLHLNRRSLLLGAAATAAAPALSTLLPNSALAAEAAAVGGNSRESFTIAVLPDTQYSVAKFHENFTAQMGWIVNQRDTYWRVRYAIHVGDLVHNFAEKPAEWEFARDTIARLDNRVPLAIAPGNHDFDSRAGGRGLTWYNKYVPYSKFDALQTAGGTPTDNGSYPSGKTNNTFHQFTAGGTDWGIITLVFDPTAADLAWARGVVAAHPSKQFIVSTHNYMSAGNGERNATGENVWNNLVKLYPNIFLVLCGHSHTGFPRTKYSVGDSGNQVVQVLADYQTGDGPIPNSYLRIMQFHPTAGTIAVKTYSPRYNTFKTDEPNQFTIDNVKFPLRAPQVRRHILNPDIRAAWRLTANDHWFLPQAEANKFPIGPVLNFGPTVLQASGGTGLYVLDRGYKRHIADPRSYQAWRFASSTRKVVTAAQLAAYPERPKWPDFPHLIRPEGLAGVYFLDTPFD